MIHSMTGFASAELQTPFGRLTWEIRSVNHRYLEISVRLPEEFRALEPAIRDLMGEHLSRGKIDASLRFSRGLETGENEWVLNAELARGLLSIHQQLQQISESQQAINLTQLLRWPGLVSERQPETEPLHKDALALLIETIGELKASRQREGEKLAAMILERVEGVNEVVSTVRSYLPEIREGLKQRLINRVADLPQDLDAGRLEQEIAFLVQKIDVDEELDRLDAHVSEAKRVISLDEPVGRRLDFLLQEFNRESNTLSSKSVDKRSTQAAVELKVLIEQMREQVQNIE